MVTIAITGITGILGRFIAEELSTKDVTIRAWKRPQSDLTGFKVPIEWIDGDLLHEHTMLDLVDNADVVIHCALEHQANKYRDGEGDDIENWLEKNVCGTLKLINKAYTHRVKKFICISSRAVYGDHCSRSVLYESSGCFPDSHYGALKLAIDGFVSSYGIGKKWQIASIRPTGIYAVTYPVEHSKWYELIKSILTNQKWASNSGGTEVHGQDVAKIIWLLISGQNDIAGAVYNCSDLYVTESDVAKIAHSICGIPYLFPQTQNIKKAIMDCSNVDQLPFKFGGINLLNKTIEELVKHVRENE